MILVGGRQVMVRKEQEIRPGMLVVYCEIDSISPDMPQSNQGKISFKAISNKYILKHGG